MERDLGDHEVHLEFKDRKHRLELIARQGNTGELISPISGNMIGKVNESMQSTIEIRLFDGSRELFHGTGRNAGLELAGEVEMLV